MGFKGRAVTVVTHVAIMALMAASNLIKHKLHGGVSLGFQCNIPPGKWLIVKAVTEETAKVEYSTPYQIPGSIWVWNYFVLYAHYDLISSQQAPVDKIYGNWKIGQVISCKCT